MSDRLAVFNHGRVEQIGTPEEIYEHPATPFVAAFVGTSNLIEPADARRIAGLDGAFSIRPERILLLAEGTSPPDGLLSAVGVIEVRNPNRDQRARVVTVLQADREIDDLVAGPGHRVGARVSV